MLLPGARADAQKKAGAAEKVTAQVFDGAGGELSALYAFNCTARGGTIEGVKAGIEHQVIVRGVRMDNEGHEIVFYEGKATGLTIDAGQTTRGMPWWPSFGSQ